MPPRLCNGDYYYHYYNNNNDNNFATMQGRYALECGHGCGWGVARCGESLCYVGFLARLPVVVGMFEALALGDLLMIIAAGNGNFPTVWCTPKCIKK